MGNRGKVVTLPIVSDSTNVDLEYVRELIDNLRKGDKKFLTCMLASQYIRSVYGVHCDAYEYCIDKQIEAFKKAESYMDDRGHERKVPPPPNSQNLNRKSEYQPVRQKGQLK